LAGCRGGALAFGIHIEIFGVRMADAAFATDLIGKPKDEALFAACKRKIVDSDSGFQ